MVVLGGEHFLMIEVPLYGVGGSRRGAQTGLSPPLDAAERPAETTRGISQSPAELRQEVMGYESLVTPPVWTMNEQG